MSMRIMRLFPYTQHSLRRMGTAMSPAPIKRALLSVSDKSEVVTLGKFLSEHGVEILSTGGTAGALREAGVHVIDIGEYTGFPEILGGRVKTLHPKVHAGLLADPGESQHMADLAAHGIGTIDLVAVNLYPFEAAPSIANIDIGGQTMLRAAAKNHVACTVLSCPQQYAQVMEAMGAPQGAAPSVPLPLRASLAAAAFAHTAAYDAQVAAWMTAQGSELDDSALPQQFMITAEKQQGLRYGENPHQQAAFYVPPGTSRRAGVATATQLQGKELSYNNISDIDAAFEAVAEFTSPAVVIVKHANPCGVAHAATLAQAYEGALRCDPLSAFGGIIACNCEVDADTATLMASLFCEAIVAPSISPEAQAILAKKKNLRVLETGSLPAQEDKSLTFKSVAGGVLVQSRDNQAATEESMRVVTQRAPSPQEVEDLLFAARVCKHVKSNAIVYAKDGATVGIGAGQMSRVDSASIGQKKSCEAAEAAGEAAQARTAGCVVASDAFFPFPDGLMAVAAAGTTAVVQPGGSVRDDEVIAAADEAGIAMVFTGLRHFRH